jgi:hypothetical protein
LNWAWLPVRATSRQPSASRAAIARQHGIDAGGRSRDRQDEHFGVDRGRELAGDDAVRKRELNELKISIVPYVAAVNPGPLAPSIVAERPPQPYDPADPAKWKGCVEEPAYPADIGETTSRWPRAFWWPADSRDNNWPPIQTTHTLATCERSASPNLSCNTPITPPTHKPSTTSQCSVELKSAAIRRAVKQVPDGAAVMAPQRRADPSAAPASSPTAAPAP